MATTRWTSGPGMWDRVVRIAALAALYGAVAAEARPDPVGQLVVALWVPAGIALAALVLFGCSLWPGVLLGSLGAGLWMGLSFTAALGVAIGNVLAATLGASVMRRVAGPRRPLEGLRDVFALIGPAALLGTLVASTVAVTSLTLEDIVSTDDYWRTWREWWFSLALGDLIVTPLILSFTHPRSRRWDAARLAEALALTVVLGLASGAVFFGTSRSAVHPFGSPYVLYPLFIWAAVRFKLRGAAISIAIASGLAIWTTASGGGPFLQEATEDRLLALQTFLGCAALTALVVSGAVSDRARLEAKAHLDAAHREARFRILSLASRDFVEANLELPALFQAIARHVVAAIGDACAIRLLTEDGGRLRLVALHHAEPDAIAFLQALIGSDPQEVSATPSGSVIRTGKPMLVPKIDQADFRAWLGGRAPPNGGRYGIHGALVVPLRSRERIIGSVTLVRTAPGRPYTAEDEGLLEELSDLAGIALYNASLHEDLRNALQSRDDFLAIAGHELKTPLAAMLMQLQGVKRASERHPDKLADRVARAGRSGARLNRLINELLDVSRISAGRLTLESEWFSLSDLVRDVVTRFMEARPGTPIVLHCEDGVTGLWDRLRLDQVIDNLVGNAVKYGQGHPVEVALHADDGEAVLSITDHGIGIPPEDQRRIFLRFERAVKARDYGGLGLGLWISRQIVEASGGNIEVESEAGVGSTFTVRLPRNSPGRASVTSSRSSSHASVPPFGASNLDSRLPASPRVPEGGGR